MTDLAAIVSQFHAGAAPAAAPPATALPAAAPPATAPADLAQLLAALQAAGIAPAAPAAAPAAAPYEPPIQQPPKAADAPGFAAAAPPRKPRKPKRKSGESDEAYGARLADWRVAVAKFEGGGRQPVAAEPAAVDAVPDRQPVPARGLTDLRELEQELRDAASCHGLTVEVRYGF